MTRKVAVVYPPSYAWMARCMDGIRRYSRERGHWHLLSSASVLRGAGGSLSLGDMRGWPGDGIITLIDDARELRIARRLGIPVVNLGLRLARSPGIPRVTVDNRRCGWLAADHLLSRGLRHLALFGWTEAWYADQRLLAFRERAAESGVTCAVFLRNSRRENAKNWTRRFAEPARWLASLPRPCGVFAVHDYMAQLLIEACQEAGLRIPEDIALIGMDNDETICEHSVPTLTSISRNSGQVGWEAALLLDALMRGEAPPVTDRLLEPEGVVPRQSTDRHYCADPVTQRALDYMRANLLTSFNIDQVAEHAGASKRTLEMRFREGLQRSPHEFLTGLRVQHARILLETTERLTMEQIARECGFGTVRAFYTAFQRISGKTPGNVRKIHLAARAEITGGAE